MPVEGSSLITNWLGSGARTSCGEAEPRWLLEDEADLRLGDRKPLSGADEERHPGPAPVVDLEPQGRVRLRGRARLDAVDAEIAVVLAANVVRRVGGADRAEERHLRVLDRLRVAARRRLHRRRPHHLHEVIDDDVAQGSDGIVEMPPVLDPEVLGHRDLDRLDVVPVPDRLEHRVGEPEVEDLLDPHLPEVVVDPEELRLVDVLMQLLGERASRRQIVAERLLDDDPRVCRHARFGQAADHRPEEQRRNLEVEDRRLRALDSLRDLGVGCVVREVSVVVREPLRETSEHLLVEFLARPDDRVAGALYELLERPVVERDADDRAVQEPALLEPVQRAERHHLREVARDAEDDEDVGRLRIGFRLRLIACGACVALMPHLFLCCRGRRDRDPR